MLSHQASPLPLSLFLKKLLFCWVFVVACKLSIAARGIQFPDQGLIEPKSSALGVQSLSHWTTRKVQYPSLLKCEQDYEYHVAAAAKLLQSCPTLCDPIDGSPPGSPDPGILQARTLEWVAIPFSNAWKWKLKVKSLSRVWLLAISWTAAYQAPPSMGFSSQEYWSGLPLPSLLDETNGI